MVEKSVKRSKLVLEATDLPWETPFSTYLKVLLEKFPPLSVNFHNYNGTKVLNSCLKIVAEKSAKKLYVCTIYLFIHNNKVTNKKQWIENLHSLFDLLPELLN